MEINCICSFSSPKSCKNCREVKTEPLLSHSPSNNAQPAVKKEKFDPSNNKSRSNEKSTCSHTAVQENPNNLTPISTPTTTIERRLRIITHEASDTLNNKCNSNIKSRSSSTLVITTCSSVSETIFEECWIDLSLKYIHFLRITKDTFLNQPFSSSSYGKQINQLSFDGPCSSAELLSALEYFQETPSVVLGHGFFTPDEQKEEIMTDTYSLPPGLKFPTIKSLVINCNVNKYNTLNDSDQLIVDSKTISALETVGEVLCNLTYCDLTLPNTPEIEEALTIFIASISCKGQKTVYYSNKQITYRAGRLPLNELASERTPHESPDIEITQILTKEDKIESLTLLSSDSEDEEEIERSIDLQSVDNLPNILISSPNVRSISQSSSCAGDLSLRSDDEDLHTTNIELPLVDSCPKIQTSGCFVSSSTIPSASKTPSSSHCSVNSDEEVGEINMDLALHECHLVIPDSPMSPPPPVAPTSGLSHNSLERGSFQKCSWQESKPGMSERFIYTMIRIGDYKVTVPPGKPECMTASDRGIFFNIPHFSDETERVKIFIPIEEIVATHVYFKPTKSSVFFKTTQKFSISTRKELGMNETPEKGGYYDSISNDVCQQFIVFRIGISSQRSQDWFQNAYSDTLQVILTISHLQQLCQNIFCRHKPLPGSLSAPVKIVRNVSPESPPMEKKQCTVNQTQTIRMGLSKLSKSAKRKMRKRRIGVLLQNKLNNVGTREGTSPTHLNFPTTVDNPSSLVINGQNFPDHPQPLSNPFWVNNNTQHPGGLQGLMNPPAENIRPTFQRYPGNERMQELHHYNWNSTSE